MKKELGCCLFGQKIWLRKKKLKMGYFGGMSGGLAAGSGDKRQKFPITLGPISNAGISANANMYDGPWSTPVVRLMPVIHIYAYLCLTPSPFDAIQMTRCQEELVKFSTAFLFYPIRLKVEL